MYLGIICIYYTIKYKNNLLQTLLCETSKVKYDWEEDGDYECQNCLTETPLSSPVTTQTPLSD